MKIAIWFTIKYMFSLHHSPISNSIKILLMIKYDMSMLNGNKYVDQLLDITRNSFEEILFALESTSLTFGGKRLYFSANAFFLCENVIFLCEGVGFWCENVCFSLTSSLPKLEKFTSSYLVKSKYRV